MPKFALFGIVDLQTLESLSNLIQISLFWCRWKGLELNNKKNTTLDQKYLVWVDLGGQKDNPLEQVDAFSYDPKNPKYLQPLVQISSF